MAAIGNQPVDKVLGPDDIADGSIGSLELAPNAVFPAGTRLGFNQSAAPTGWTKDTTTDMDDSIMRIVTGSVGSGGSNGFSSVNAQSAVGNTTLTSTQLPSYTLPGGNWIKYLGSGGTAALTTGSTATAAPISSGGGGESHNHTINMNIKYRDFIVASKD